MNLHAHRLLRIAVATTLAGALLAQNNECSGAIALVPGANGPFTNVGSTTSAPAWPCSPGANDVWFSFTAVTPGIVTVSTCANATFDTVLQIFSGNCGSLVSVGCDDDSCGPASSIGLPVVAGTYRVRVGGFNGATGTFSLQVNGLNGTTLATNTTLGNGCQRRSTSFYEVFNTGPNDLSNTTLTMIPAGGNYTVQSGGASYLAPSAAATVLPLTDDSEMTVLLANPMPFPGGSTTGLTVCSNGFVSIAPGNGNIAYTWPTEFLDALHTAWRVWHDFDPSIPAGGRIKFEQVGTKACVTWDGVWRFGGTSAAHASTFQFQFDTSNGRVHIVFRTMSAQNYGMLVGYSPGGPSLDAGPIDISAALAAPFTLPANDGLPLTLTAASRPILGATWSLNVTNFPAGATLGVDILGFTDPSLNDLTSLGLPGCGLRSSLEVVSAWGPAGSVHNYLVGLPANPALSGRHLYTTSAMFVPGINAFGAVTANGIDGLLGDY